MKSRICILFLAFLLHPAAVYSAPQKLDGALGEEIVGVLTNHPKFLYSEPTNKVIYLATKQNTSIKKQLHSVNLDGSEPIKYGNSELHSRIVDFQLSPDKQTIVFRNFDSLSNNTGLWSVPVEGGTPARLDSSSELANEFFINPASSHVIYANFGSYYSVPLGGGAITDVIDVPFAGSPLGRLPSITPDGKTLTFLMSKQDSEDRNAYLVAAPTLGGQNVVLQRNELGEVVSGNRLNDRVVIFDYRDISTIPVGGGTPTIINTNLADNEFIEILDTNVSSNMQTIAYVTTTSFTSPQQLNLTSLAGGDSLQLNSILDGLKSNCGIFFSNSGNKLVWCEKLESSEDHFYSYINLASHVSQSNVINLNDGKPLSGRTDNIVFDEIENRVFISSRNFTALEGAEDYSSFSLPLSGGVGQKLYAFDSDADFIDFCSYRPIFNDDYSKFLSCRVGKPN